MSGSSKKNDSPSMSNTMALLRVDGEDEIDGEQPIVLSSVVPSVRSPVVAQAMMLRDSGAPNTARLLMSPRKEVVVNISPRARWSSSSEGKRTRKFPRAIMVQPSATVRNFRIPRLPSPPEQATRRRRRGRLGLRFIINPPQVTRRNVQVPRLAPPMQQATRRRRRGTLPPQGEDMNSMSIRWVNSSDDELKKRRAREWKKTRKDFKRKFGFIFPKSDSSSSSSSDSSLSSSDSSNTRRRQRRRQQRRRQQQRR